MELRHLRYFDAVARAGGFGRAATVLNLAQPALSRQIRDLETDLGVRLFERSAKGVALTPAGEGLRAGVQRVLAAVEAALRTTRSAATGREGRCVMGVGRIVMSLDPMACAVVKLHETLPHADIAIEEVLTFDQPAQILDGTLDVGVGMVPSADGIAHEPWQIVEYSCANLAIGHPLAHREFLEPEDLADEPVAFMSDERAPELAKLFRRGLDRAGITSPQEFIYSSPLSVAMMVASGRGWAPGPARRFRSRQYPGLVTIPVRGLEFSLRLDLLWRKTETRAIVMSVLEVLRACADERPPSLPSDTLPRHLLPGIPPGLELRQLRYFAAVADDGGFGRAAERLRSTQPSLSRQVADLEHLVGAQLLERSVRGTTLTDAGRALREGVRAICDEVEALQGVTKQARRGLVGRCIIGAIPTTAAGSIISRVRKQCAVDAPGVRIVPEDYATPRQPDAVREGRIDIGICHAFGVLTDDPHIAHRRLVADTVTCALLAEDHPLARRDRIEAAELEHVPFLFMARSFHAPFYDRVYAALADLGLSPRVDATYDALHTVWALVAQNKGWALSFGVRPEEPPEGIAAVPIDGLSLPWGLDVMWRRHEINPVVGRVLDIMGVARGDMLARHDLPANKVLEPT